MNRKHVEPQRRSVSQIVIPARMASTRLPRKLLLRETGKSLIRHTYEAARRATRPIGVRVATDHKEILDEVQSFGGDAVMTSRGLTSGTDRVAEVAAGLPEVDIIVNMQGDEPELRGEFIDYAISLLEENPDVPMATLAAPIRERSLLNDHACVKVVFDVSGRALYFSRACIPYPRQWDDRLLREDPPHFYQHIGLYAYRRQFLLQLAGMRVSDLEQLEKLEQLRVLHAGFPILVGVIGESSAGIDTADDYCAFVKRVRNA